ncbi:MAG: hypothetical protein D6729_03895 [Deltaproteobacteria bacterium]|nr:MAG: hypothetical protein D6729_03895 [Deltaproteobacteria bacterium]
MRRGQEDGFDLLVVAFRPCGMAEAAVVLRLRSGCFLLVRWRAVEVVHRLDRVTRCLRLGFRCSRGGVLDEVTLLTGLVARDVTVAGPVALGHPVAIEAGERSCLEVDAMEETQGDPLRRIDGR